MKDIVYFLKETLPLDGAELRYSLRSIVNLPHSRVWAVTPQLPDWVVGVKHIPWEQRDGVYEDLSSKYLAIAKYKGDMAQGVYIMDDDIYTTKPLTHVPIYQQSTVKQLMAIRHPVLPDQFGIALHKTYSLMTDLGWQHVPMHPCQHAPYPMRRDNIPTHLDDGHGPYEYKTLYANWLLLQGGKLADMMYRDPKAYDDKTIRKILGRKEGFLSTLEGEHEFAFKHLAKLFPKPGPYERA